MSDINQLEHDKLGAFINKEVISSSKKLKGSYPALSEKVGNKPMTLEVKAFYQLHDLPKRFHLLVVKNHSKSPKLRYFLLVSLASQSSDLLVKLAKAEAIEHDLSLVQYQLQKDSPRVSLLCLKELTTKEEYEESIALLKQIWNDFREKMDKLTDLTQI